MKTVTFRTLQLSLLALTATFAMHAQARSCSGSKVETPLVLEPVEFRSELTYEQMTCADVQAEVRGLFQGGSKTVFVELNSNFIESTPITGRLKEGQESNSDATTACETPKKGTGGSVVWVRTLDQEKCNIGCYFNAKPSLLDRLCH